MSDKKLELNDHIQCKVKYQEILEILESFQRTALLMIC